MLFTIVEWLERMWLRRRRPRITLSTVIANTGDVWAGRNCFTPREGFGVRPSQAGSRCGPG
jgi:hypothetical protein